MVGIFRKTKRDIYLKNLGLLPVKGQSDQEHLHLILNIFLNEIILYENVHWQSGVGTKEPIPEI